MGVLRHNPSGTPLQLSNLFTDGCYKEENAVHEGGEG